MISTNNIQKPLLNIQNVTVKYFKKEILRSASLSVMPGEIVALLGANGSGKSSLLKTVAGILPALGGTILFDGVEITAKPTHEIVNLGIGFLMQGNGVFNSFTVLENLSSVIIASPKEKNERIEEMLTLFPALRDQLTKRAGLLSGGDRQKLALSMVLMKKPKLLLLDEPSDGLSPYNVHAIFESIVAINKRQYVTIVLVEQNLREALKMADRVCVAKNGRLFLVEHPKEILSNRNLEEIFFS